MRGLNQYLIPYLITQVVAVALLLIAWKHTRLARLLFVPLFTWASATNFTISTNNPKAYLDYADKALPFYRDFINGWFSKHIQVMVALIASGQLIIATGMLLKGWWVKAACIGAIVFLLAIATLMVGAGFPFSLVVSWAVWLVLKRDKKEYLWQKPQPLSANYLS